jgi:hypothetical protein
MFLKRRVAACTALIAALAIPVASAGAASTTPANDPPVLTSDLIAALGLPAWIGAVPTPTAEDSSLGSPRCPDWYVGPTNLATGCPWYLIH